MKSRVEQTLCTVYDYTICFLLKIFFVDIKLNDIQKKCCPSTPCSDPVIDKDALIRDFNNLTTDEEKSARLAHLASLLTEIKDEFSHLEAGKALLYEKHRVLLTLSAFISTASSVILIKLQPNLETMAFQIALIASISFSVLSFFMLISFIDVHIRHTPELITEEALLPEHEFIATRLQDYSICINKNTESNRFKARMYKASRRAILLSTISLYLSITIALVSGGLDQKAQAPELPGKPSTASISGTAGAPMPPPAPQALEPTSPKP